MTSISNLEDELALVSVNESNSSTYDILLKIMALGDTGVGKDAGNMDWKIKELETIT